MANVLYNLDQIEAELDRFPGTSGRTTSRPALYHSFKANTFRPLLAWFKAQGMGASVANETELALAREMGFTSICATSPAFDAAAIGRLRGLGVDVFLSTFQQLEAVPEGSDICLRVRVTKNGSPFPSRFGFDAQHPNLHRALKAKRLKVVGLLLHHRNIETRSELEAHIDLADAAVLQFDSVEWINLGGGMTAFAQNQAAWSNAWQQICERHAKSPLMGLASFEPGAQHLSGSAYLMAQVQDVSMSDGRVQRAIIDASHWVLNGWSNIRPILSEGDLATDLYGPTCYENDVWCRDQRTTRLTPGDMLGFANVGSYITSMARRFCLMELPHEWLMRAGQSPDLAALRKALAEVTSSQVSPT